MTYDHRDSGHVADARGKETLLGALMQHLADLRSETVHNSDGTSSLRWNRDEITRFENAVVEAGSWPEPQDAPNPAADNGAERMERVSLRITAVLLGVVVLTVFGSLFLLIAKYS